MKKQSNLYTIIYSTVLVLIVGIALSLVYQALRPQQLENIANDTKRQILAAALITPAEGETVSELYNNHIKNSFIVNADGEVVTSDTDPFDIKVSEEVKKDDDKRQLPIFICDLDNGEQKYIIPVYGAGLWGPIWGYIAFNADGNSIYGAYFAHEGETPGLGAEIEKPAFQKQFEGTTIFDQDNAFKSVKVVKRGQEPAEGSYVHAISGGTITSQGVQKMLENSLRPYTNYLKKLNKGKEDNL